MLQEQGPAAAYTAEDRPEPTEREKAHVRKLKRLVDAALRLNKERFALFEKWRAAYAGFLHGQKSGTEADQARSNMIYANIAALMPQVYAKNPDFSFAPSQAVAPRQYEVVKKFAATAEIVVTRQLHDAGLKVNAKAQVRSAMTTSIGWWKVAFQEDRRTDPVILNQINDLQDNLERMRALSKQIRDDHGSSEESEAKAAELEAQIMALQQQPEITVGRGTVIDTLQSEDVIILDPTIKAFHEYVRSARIAHRIWLSEDAFYERFGYKPKKARRYRSANLEDSQEPGKDDECFYQVFEIWDHTCNTVFTICEGEEGYCRAPFVPQHVGRRWYPFFALGFNPVDGRFYPLSDVELSLKLAREYNENRDDLDKHRKDSMPARLARKGGALTEEDATKIANRQSADIIFVSGIPGKPLSEDIAEFKNVQIDPAVYDTTPARSDMEQILGGGDAARGTVMKAKTATEAEIMAMGMRSRTEERQDTIEDMLADVARYTFEICLGELSPEEVQRIAGPEAEWPELAKDDALSLVNVEIKAGTTGKPNKLQEQDRWIELLPIVKEAMMAVVELRNAGQVDIADGILELLRETFRRFDERLDIDKFIPPMAGTAELEQMTPDQLKAALIQAHAIIQQLQQQLAQFTDEAAAADAAAARDASMQDANAARDVNKAQQLANIKDRSVATQAAVKQAAAPPVMQ